MTTTSGWWSSASWAHAAPAPSRHHRHHGGPSWRPSTKPSPGPAPVSATRSAAGQALELYPAVTLVKVALVERGGRGPAAVLTFPRRRAVRRRRGAGGCRGHENGTVPGVAASKSSAARCRPCLQPYRRRDHPAAADQGLTSTSSPTTAMARRRHGHARVAAELRTGAAIGSVRLRLCVRVDVPERCVRSPRAAAAELRVTARRWTDWFASLGEHAVLREHPRL